MTVTLYTNNSERIRLDKDLTSLTTVTATLKEPTSILKPTLQLAGVQDYITKANYAYITEFGRYYYMGNPTALANGLWEIPCEVDALTTYASAIREQEGIITRQENDYDLKLNDSVIKTEQVPRIGTYVFPAGFTTLNFVLALAGQ